MGKSFSCLFRWFVIFLLVLLQIQMGSGLNETSTEVISLRVGVPKKDGFPQFVSIVWDPHVKKNNVSGYCMEVFNAVVNSLPFKVSLDIEPYLIDSGGSATYDALVRQIPANYDVAVGDITIVANRSQFVDFTLPFTESGVKMLVPVQHGRHQTMWIFARPFSWDLWLSIVVISMFIGIVILIMERNVNAMPDQQGSAPNPKQLSVITIFWFPISLAVLPEREVVAKNCSRFVLMVWLLLSFVLMQSYTANLTSILTLDQLQPSVLSVEELIKGDCYVGYQVGSFVHDLLVQRLKFNPSKLKPYSNISAYRHALKVGSQGGGVSAIFDEVAYLKVFLQKYGSNYIITGPTYRTDGFGFAFPFNSNLTAYFSRGILNVTESEIMDEIEEKYFGKKDIIGGQEQSAQLSSSSTSPSLTFQSFSGLFLITGIAILLALLISETVIWQRSFRWLKDKTYNQSCLFSTPTSSTQTPVHPNDDSTLQEIPVA